MDFTPFVSTETLIKQAFPNNYERMIAIAHCESGFKQFDINGDTITSHTLDSGLFQINQATWDKKAQELGLDYKNSEIDNIKMAKHVYEVQGQSAWVCDRLI